ncbi:hypothetical protein L2E82_11748 [Cichorium intybus]|uniref:Uncharacterized protein n=1 Tax=Cichorium intybus TaxID=13427 RepID=A0ACB9GE67_CICIN|nr:hypothetical protein L2E82_11748 [Cichorium intybus]
MMSWNHLLDLFECNTVRRIIESHHVHMIEPDVSMDSGFKEELRILLIKKQVKVWIVLVKGRLIGGSDGVMKLEEEGKLGILLDGILTVAVVGYKGCAGYDYGQRGSNPFLKEILG